MPAATKWRPNAGSSFTTCTVGPSPFTCKRAQRVSGRKPGQGQNGDVPISHRRHFPYSQNRSDRPGQRASGGIRVHSKPPGSPHKVCYSPPAPENAAQPDAYYLLDIFFYPNTQHHPGKCSMMTVVCLFIGV